MGLAGVLLSVAGYVLALARFTRWPAAALPAVVTSTIVIGLYAAALAGALKPAAWIIFAGGILALVPGIAAARRTLADPGIAVLLFLGALFWIRMHDAAYHNWDEFSHWGVVTKEIVRLDGLPLASSPLKFLSYPPASALFQYYLALFAGYDEGVTIFAQAILTLSMVAVLLQGLDWSRSTALALTAFTAVLLVFVLGNGLKSLLIDHVVAVYFGAAIAMVLLAPQRDAAAITRALPLLMVLPLLKAVGMFLAVVAAITIACLVLVGRAALPSWRAKALVALACMAAFALPYLSSKSWAIHVRESHFAQAVAPQLSVAQFARTVSGAERTERDDKVISSFVSAWSAHTVQKSGWTSVIWVIVLVAGFAIAGWRCRERRAEIVVVGTIMVVGCALYSAGLLMLYLYNFSDYEATRSLQFGRYMSIFLLGWAWVGLALLRASPAAVARRWVRVATCAGGAALLAFLVHLAPIPNLQQSRPQERAEIRSRAPEIARRVPADKSVYIIWEYSKGVHYWVLRYELLPRRTNSDCSSLGQGFDETDVWTCNLSQAELARKLAAFDYVLVARSNDALRQVLAPFLDGAALDHDWMLFAVEAAGDRLRLRPA